MADSEQIDRRDFLRVIFIAAGVSVVGGGAYFFLQDETLNQPLTKESFRNQFSGLEENFRMIGQKYLEKYPQGLQESELLREINDKLSSGTINKNILSNLSDLVRQQVLLDFEESHLVKLNGWIITETEAQICAVISK